MHCARHPQVETGLRCNRCETPICPDCARAAAVGFLCPDCAKTGVSPLYKVRPERLALTLGAGLAAGVVVGLVLQYIGFFLCFVAPFLGGMVGDLIRRTSGGKAGPVVEGIVVVSIVGGALLAAWLSGAWAGHLQNPVSLAFFVLALILAVGAALSRVRF